MSVRAEQCSAACTDRSRVSTHSAAAAPSLCVCVLIVSSFSYGIMLRREPGPSNIYCTLAVSTFPLNHCIYSSALRKLVFTELEHIMT